PMLTRRGFMWATGALGLLPRLEAHAQSTVPLRFVGIFHTNGVVGSQWKPTTFGPSYTLPYSLTPLSAVKQHVSVISNMRLGPNADMGSHGGGQICFLTSSDSFSGSTSLDVAIGKLTQSQVRLPTLNLGIENNGYYMPSTI